MLQSRKFRALVLDAVFASAVYAVTNFVAPQYGEHAIWFIATLQPIVIAYVLGTAQEDVAAYEAGLHPKQLAE